MSHEITPERCRRVVLLAAEGDHSASEWLRRDEFGGREQEARKWLEAAYTKPNVLEFTPEAVDEECSLMLRLSCLEGLLADAKKRGAKKSKRK